MIPWNLNGVLRRSRPVGPDTSVVVSTRLRVRRNLAGRPFLGTLSPKELHDLRGQVESALDREDEAAWMSAQPTQVNLADRGILVERGWADPSFQMGSAQVVALHAEEHIAVQIAHQDHVRLLYRRPGLDLEGALASTLSLEESLGRDLGWAFHPRFGYLFPEAEQVGHGLEASVLFHLPGLVRAGLLDELMRNALAEGFRLHGYGSQDAGHLYWVSWSPSPSSRTEGALDPLQRLALTWSQWEARARTTLWTDRKAETADWIWRAFGVLKYAELLGQEEAWDLISRYRLGLALGLLNGSSASAAELWLSSQKAHVAALAGLPLDSADPEDLDSARAKLLKKKIEPEGDVDV